MADGAAPASAVIRPLKNPNYTAVFVAELIDRAGADERIVAITAGMPTGTGLSTFQAAYPNRFIDVGIAEQHSMALATGLAMGGMRPVVALYSTFLQRAFDQTVHDVCQNDQPVVIAVDRSGLVGEDGTSHQGMFTLPAQRQLPNLVIASPKDEQELRSLVRTALAQDHPVAPPARSRGGSSGSGASGSWITGRSRICAASCAWTPRAWRSRFARSWPRCERPRAAPRSRPAEARHATQAARLPVDTGYDRTR